MGDGVSDLGCLPPAINTAFLYQLEMEVRNIDRILLTTLQY